MRKEYTNNAMKEAYEYADNYFTGGDVKPMFLMGPTGTGKTSLFETMLIEHYPKVGTFIDYANATGKQERRCIIINAQDIVDKFNEIGPLYWQHFAQSNIVIDDLGVENTGYYYGNKSESLVGELIYRRHKNKLITHFTSNLSIEQLSDRYGDRVIDRLAESNELFHLIGESLRRK